MAGSGGTNVLDVDYDEDAVYSATKRCLFDEEWRLQCRNTVNPYGAGESGRKIAEILATIPLDQRLLRKHMTLQGELKDGWYR